MQGDVMKSSAQLWREIQQTEVSAGSLAFWWLYQAGIVLKSPAGVIVAVDPYLSESVMRSYKLPRGVPAPLDPADADVDALLATHSHEDHLDPDSIEPFLRPAQARFVGPPMAADKVRATGVDPSRITPVGRGDEVTIGDIGVRAVHARHMFGLEPTPDAVGYVLSCGEVSVYHSGDTEYDSEIIGNMNVHEAALLAWLQGARLAVPFHYGLWRDADYGEGATLDPGQFADTYGRLNPGGRVHILQAATRVVVGPDGLAV
jgi:L-ascorbate metabolism protein UlaG (beta-lactamase superfamily)